MTQEKPSRKRIVLAFFVACLLGGFIPAILIVGQQLVQGIQHGNIPVTSVGGALLTITYSFIVAPFYLALAAPFILIIGIPLFLFYRKKGWYSRKSHVIGGIAIGIIFVTTLIAVNILLTRAIINITYLNALFLIFLAIVTGGLGAAVFHRVLYGKQPTPPSQSSRTVR